MPHAAPANQQPTAPVAAAQTPLRLRLRGVSAGYGDSPVVNDVDLAIPVGSITCLIGPNGCGKSTLLKSIATLLDARGEVLLDDEDIRALKRSERARRLAMLPQHPTAPDALTVAELVARGRHPHQSWAKRWNREDDALVLEALQLTGTLDLAERPISELSGGQRQRVWIAMTLAQDTPTILLDEPTTYLDLAHSLDVLHLVRKLATEQQKTIVMVLHDLNLAIRFATHLVAMTSDGTLYGQGQPKELITEPMLASVFGLNARVVEDPVTQGPLIVPELEPLPERR